MKKKQFVFAMLAVLIGIGGVLVSNLKVLAQVPIEFQYIYDGNQRLVRAIDSEGNVLTYTYDPVGNLLSITRATAASLIPVITGLTPGSVNRSETQEIVITGTGLLGSRLSIGNPEITINNIIITDTEVWATLTTAADAPLGSTTLTVTTPLGAASTAISVKDLLPRLIRLSPASGTSFGGTAVTLTGIHFTPDAAITFDGKFATDVVFISPEEMTVMSPPGDPGILVDLEVINTNGRTSFLRAFKYEFNFSIPNVLSIEVGKSSDLTVTLNEPGATVTAITLTSASPAIASLPATATIPAGDTVVKIPVTAVAEGTSTVTVTIEGASLPLTVFVTPPLTGTFEIYSSPVGNYVAPDEPLTLAPIVGNYIAPEKPLTTLAPVVGTYVAPDKPLSTLAPVVGTYVTPIDGITLAPVVGVEVLP